MRPPWKAIAAMSQNRAIGKGGGLPWHIPDDLKFFKTQTKGGIMVMGRKTYESIGRPLPGRETIVLTQQQGLRIPGVSVINQVEVLDHLATQKTIWICGGAEIYRLLLPKCDEILLTVVHRNIDGDAFFPDFESVFSRSEVIQEHPDFTIHRYLRES